MRPTEDRVVWRMTIGFRAIPIFGISLLEAFLIFTATMAPTEPVVWIFLAVISPLAVSFVLSLRRSCVIENGQLIAQGRFARRRVDLSDLRQVGVGIVWRVWIQTHHPLDKRGGDVLCLRMIPISNVGSAEMGGPPGAEAVVTIRRLAEAAGATLDPPLDRPMRAPSKHPLIFSI